MRVEATEDPRPATTRADDASGPRSTSFGEDHALSVVDRLGTWLSFRAIRSSIGNVSGRTVADIGCGYDARFAVTLIGRARHVVLADVSVAASISDPSVTTVLGLIPGSLEPIETGSVDVVLMNSVLEHLDDPSGVLRELRRISNPVDGVVFVNVPSWLGKRALEFSAFRLGTSPRLEIEDHRRYYNRQQLWQQLRDAGFRPSEIRVRTHKLGLNTFAVCRRSAR